MPDDFLLFMGSIESAAIQWLIELTVFTVPG
jgi:hypothetical protein